LRSIFWEQGFSCFPQLLGCWFCPVVCHAFPWWVEDLRMSRQTVSVHGEDLAGRDGLGGCWGFTGSFVSVTEHFCYDVI
jgi:hypothetical protein